MCAELVVLKKKCLLLVAALFYAPHSIEIYRLPKMVGQGGSLADGWEYAAGVGAATQWIFVVAQGYLFVPLLREKTRRVCDAGAGARETGGFKPRAHSGADAR